MTAKSLRITLIIGLALISLGGFLLHSRIHPLYVETHKEQINDLNKIDKIKVKEFEGYGLIPFVSGLTSIILITVLFCFRRTAAYAYLISGMTVIIGTITMAHFGIAKAGNPFMLFADIAILLGKFPISKAIFESYMIPDMIKKEE